MALTYCICWTFFRTRKTGLSSLTDGFKTVLLMLFIIILIVRSLCYVCHQFLVSCCLRPSGGHSLGQNCPRSAFHLSGFIRDTVFCISLFSRLVSFTSCCYRLHWSFHLLVILKCIYEWERLLVRLGICFILLEAFRNNGQVSKWSCWP